MLREQRWRSEVWIDLRDPFIFVYFWNLHMKSGKKTCTYFTNFVSSNNPNANIQNNSSIYFIISIFIDKKKILKKSVNKTISCYTLKGTDTIKLPFGFFFLFLFFTV